jgi:hypothetical protein
MYTKKIILDLEILILSFSFCPKSNYFKLHRLYRKKGSSMYGMEHYEITFQDGSSDINLVLYMFVLFTMNLVTL